MTGFEFNSVVFGWVEYLWFRRLTRMPNLGESSTTIYELRKSLDSGYDYEKCEKWTADNFTESKMAYECEWKGLGEDYTVKQTGKPRENILGILLFSIGIALAITRTKDDETRVSK